MGGRVRVCVRVCGWVGGWVGVCEICIPYCLIAVRCPDSLVPAGRSHDLLNLCSCTLWF